MVTPSNFRIRSIPSAVLSNKDFGFLKLCMVVYTHVCVSLICACVKCRLSRNYIQCREKYQLTFRQRRKCAPMEALTWHTYLHTILWMLITSGEISKYASQIYDATQIYCLHDLICPKVVGNCHSPPYKSRKEWRLCRESKPKKLWKNCWK